MSSREQFIRTLKDELPRFERVVKAVPDSGLDYRPHERSRTTREILALLADEAQMLAPLVLKGELDMDGAPGGTYASAAAAAAAVTAGIESGADAAGSVNDEIWTSTARLLAGGAVAWETTREKMAWGFLLDLVHHRGQLSVYLRPMGARVPPIYGPSADAND